jgi:hypothetical protein
MEVAQNKNVSIEVIENLDLKFMPHHNAYRVSCLQKGHTMVVSKQCIINFKIGNYHEDVLHDATPMDTFHILLGRHSSLIVTYNLMEKGTLTNLRRKALNLGCFL